MDAGKALTTAERLIAEAEAEFRGIELPASLPKRGENPHLGRPMEYDSHVLAAILEQVADGVPLAKVCRDRGNRPNYTTVMRWAELSRRIMIALARARVEGFARLELEMLEIADDAARDFVETEKGQRYNPEAVQRSKLRIETREKLLKVWNAERWHDVLRVQHDHRGMPVANAGPGGAGGHAKALNEYTTQELLAFIENAAAEEASMNAGESDEDES